MIGLSLFYPFFSFYLIFNNFSFYSALLPPPPQKKDKSYVHTFIMSLFPILHLLSSVVYALSVLFRNRRDGQLRTIARARSRYLTTRTRDVRRGKRIDSDLITLLKEQIHFPWFSFHWFGKGVWFPSRVWHFHPTHYVLKQAKRISHWPQSYFIWHLRCEFCVWRFEKSANCWLVYKETLQRTLPTKHMQGNNLNLERVSIILDILLFVGAFLKA